MKQINEGMRIGDLEDLVLPLVSVDEYISKLDDKSIVFGLYVNDKDAANDLNRFVQKSPAPILDTEVSPAPDQRGYFLVFFEAMNDSKIGDTLQSILDEVSPLAQIEKWELRMRGQKDLQPFDKEKVNEHFKQMRDEAERVEKEETNESILRFLQPSTLHNATISGDQIILEGMGYKSVYDVVAFGTRDALVSESEWSKAPLGLAVGDLLDELRIDRMLGEGWSATRMGGVTVVGRMDDDQIIVLRNR